MTDLAGWRQIPDEVIRFGAALIPPRRNAKPWKAITTGAVARNEALRASKYLGRALWRRWTGYHRRSCAETEMDCVEMPGQRLMARNFDRQVAGFQVRVVVPTPLQTQATLTRRLEATGAARCAKPG